MSDNDGRKVDYISSSYFTEVGEYDGSDSENKDDKNDEKPDEVYRWDVFREFPSANKIGSMEDMTLYEYSLQAIKLLTYLVLFLLILFGGFLSRATILLAISQIRPTKIIHYYEYNRPEIEVKNLTIEISEKGKIAWYWCIFIAFSVPEIFSCINTVYHLLFKKKKLPRAWDLIFVCFVEGSHATALALLFLVILPEFNSALAVAVSSCIYVLPTILGLFSRNRQDDLGYRYITKITGDLIILLIQISYILILIFLYDLNNTSKWLLPFTLLFSSLRWWSNYISSKSSLRIIQFLCSIKERLESSRGIVQGVSAIVRVIAFFVASLLIIYLRNISINDFFTNFPGFGMYHVAIKSFKHNYSIEQTTEVTDDHTIHSSVVFTVLLIHVVASCITYATSKFAVRTLMQSFGFAFPASLTVPATIIGIFFICIHQKNYPYLTANNHNCLFFNEPPYSSLAEALSQWQCWMWIFVVISQVWVTSHIWVPHCERLASEKRIFAVYSYDSLVIDQSLMLNRRKDLLDNVLDTEDVNKEKHNFVRYSQNASSAIKPRDRMTKVLACATMWHETKEEMMQFVNSILRLDLCQAAMRFAQKQYKIQVADYFELETHIFFDDAFRCMHGCETVCDHHEDETHVNNYVKTLINVFKKSVERLSICANPPTKYPAPYGGVLEWILPGKNKLIVHLKDKNKIRHRKRWSQVMYMYYLLGYRLISRPIQLSRKEIIAENTFILTLDGDIDFRPNAVKVLLHLMKRDKDLGAACGRIHPIGSGPMVWFQKFEYAIGHWLQKSTEHTIGSVLCSPGCFSLFRAKALMEDNVMRRYATKSEEARHYIQYDQGEDRWLCTLVLQSGYRVEYSAASDSYTHAPETFNEFYNQRRRWIPSTIANIYDLLNTSKETRKVNENISWLYIFYQWILMGSTVLGPGTIFLMLVGAFVAAFKIDNWSSFMYNLLPILIFIIVCFTSKPSIQLIVAASISTLYGLVMIIVLVGIMLQIAEDGWVAPSTILFFVVVGQLFIAGFLHPQELSCLSCIVIYYITVPSMYLILIIYSFFNVHNVTWGTRESSTTISTKPNAMQAENKESDGKSLKNNLLKNGSVDNSFINLCRCMFCVRESDNEESLKLDRIADILEKVAARLDALEKNIISPEVQPAKNQTHELQSSNNCTNDDEESEIQSECPSSLSNQESNMRSNNYLISPYWIQDPDLCKGQVEFLTHDEEVFWQQLIKKYLRPLDEDKNKLEKVASDLKKLRNENLFKFFMVNALFIFVIFLMQLNKDTLHLQWPLGLSYNITYRHSETMEVHLRKDYLRLEPIGCLFIVGFGLILLIQFIAMLFHRCDTFIHLLANTSLKFKCSRKSETILSEELLEDYVQSIVKDLQQLAENNANSTAAMHRSSITMTKKRNTVHSLIENQGVRTKLPTNFDAIFRQNLGSTRFSQRIFSRFNHGSIVPNSMQEITDISRNNMAESIYQSVSSANGYNCTNYSRISRETVRTSQNYDNQAFVNDATCLASTSNCNTATPIN